MTKCEIRKNGKIIFDALVKCRPFISDIRSVYHSKLMHEAIVAAEKLKTFAGIEQPEKEESKDPRPGFYAKAFPKDERLKK